MLCLTTIISFSAAIFPQKIYAGTLTPLSFSQMYNLAQAGDVEALRASVRRGMNIDSLNTDGNTGLCLAAQNRDAYTYNAFRAAGANPRHPCTQRISDYENFINSSKAVSLQSSARDAYGTMGKEHFEISPVTWWVIGGLAIGGGIAALAMSGGGGGGGSSSSDEKEEYTSLADKLGSAEYSTTGEKKITAKVSVSNDGTAETLKKIAGIDFSESVLENADNLKVGFNAYDGGTYTNPSGNVIETNSGTIGMLASSGSTVNNEGYIFTDSYNASILMAASEESSAVNNGEGIVSGSGDNGLYLSFSGYADNDSVIGMYADSNSVITNNGDISGSAIKTADDPTADDSSDDSSSEDDTSENGSSSSDTESSSASVGTIIGMEARIINTGSNISSKAITVQNNGNIKLNGGNADSGSDVKLSLIGMGSFLEDDFTNGAKNIERAETASLENKGTISLGYTGNYSASADDALRKGEGGIVGMRTDAKTTAVNKGNIIIDLTNESSSEDSTGGSDDSQAISAAMQSVHGGSIENSTDGEITIKTTASNSRINYGMLSSEGNGTVSNLFSNVAQDIKNNGIINIKASNSYGMASYNGGTLINNNSIVLGVENNAYYSSNAAMLGDGSGYSVSMFNNGTIDIYSYDSYAMKNNYTGGTVITNDGTIHIHSSAANSLPFAGNYSELVNNGTIIYEANAVSSSSDSSSSSSSASSSDSADVSSSSEQNNADKFSLAVDLSVMTTKSAISSGSGTQKIYNNGTITLDGVENIAAMAVETSQGVAYNTGTINIGKSDIENNNTNVGMYLTGDKLSASLSNSGTINVNTDFSIGMAGISDSKSGLINEENGVINVYGDDSFGMYAQGNSYIYNNGEIHLYGDRDIGIFSSGDADIQQEGKISNAIIYIHGSYGTAFQISGTSEVIDPGTVRICSGENNCNSDAQATMTYYYVTGNLTLGIQQSLQKGTIIKMGESGTLTVTEKAALTIYSSGGKIIDGSAGGTVTVKEKATLNLQGENDIAIISGNGNTTENSGRINVAGANSYGVYLKDSGTVANAEEGEIIVSKTGSYGVYGNQITGSFTNEGKIAVETDNSYGIYAVGKNSSSSSSSSGDSSAAITNNGIINIGGVNEDSGETVTVDNSYGIYADGYITVTNAGKINVYGSGDSNNPSYGIYVKGKNSSATNSGEIYVSGSGSYGLWAENDGTAVNTGTVIAENGATACNAAVTDETTENTETQSVMVRSGGTIKNYGKIITDAALDFDAASDGTGKIMINKKGSYSAKSLKGTVIAGADITQNSFADRYINKNSFSGTDEGLNIVSGSYMFTAEKENQANGKTDIVMTRKSFADVSSHYSLAEFLENNYQLQKGGDYFDILKEATDEISYRNAENTLFGFRMLPNLTKQNFDLLKNLNREINTEVFASDRSFVKASYYNQEINNKKELTGYNSDIYSVYGNLNNSLNSQINLGYGLAATRAEYDFDDGSSRYNNLLEIFLPVTYKKDELKALVKPKAGFARGHYRRVAENSVYKADTKNYFYGVDTEARVAYFSDILSLEPNVGFNVTSIYSDSSKEKNGIRLKSKNTTSVQSVLGLDLKKDIPLNDKQLVSLIAGGKYYHEFGNRYRTKASVDGMAGNYILKDIRLQRNYGLLSLKAQYECNNLAIGATVNLPLEQKSNPYYLFDLKYKF